MAKFSQESSVGGSGETIHRSHLEKTQTWIWHLNWCWITQDDQWHPAMRVSCGDGKGRASVDVYRQCVGKETWYHRNLKKTESWALSVPSLIFFKCTRNRNTPHNARTLMCPLLLPSQRVRGVLNTLVCTLALYNRVLDIEVWELKNQEHTIWAVL